MLKIGFTGTRKGMTKDQFSKIRQFLDGLEFIANHGDCEGGDEDFDVICHDLGAERHLFPSTSKTRRFSERERPERCIMAQAPKEPMARNPDIVNFSEIMLGGPGMMEEELRSGTWATIRYARKIRRPVVIFWPDGSITKEGFDD